MEIKKSKKAQVAIFIILAIAIVIVLVLLFIGRGNITTLLTGESPVETIKSCVLDSFEPALETIALQGGSLNPQNYYLYQNNKVDYLCYTEENYAQCIMQKPLLKQSMEKELKEYIEPKAIDCINAVKESLRGKGYEVSSKAPEISVTFVPSSVLIDIKMDLRYTKDTTEVYESIKIDTNSGLYEMIMTASSISNWEARYGDSDTLTYMIYYPSLRVEKNKFGDGTTIYTLTNTINNDQFIFASRSVAIPAGVTGY